MERNVRLSCLMAWLLWTAAVMLTLGGSSAALEDHRALALVLFSHAVLAMGAGATMTVRNLFERQNRLMQDAYRLGRDHPSAVARIGAGATL